MGSNGEVSQRRARPDLIVLRLPLPDGRLQRREVKIAVVALPELVSAGPGDELDVAVELGTAWRHAESGVLVLAGRLVGHDLAAPSTLRPVGDRLDWHGQAVQHLGQEVARRQRPVSVLKTDRSLRFRPTLRALAAWW